MKYRLSPPRADLSIARNAFRNIGVPGSNFSFFNQIARYGGSYNDTRHIYTLTAYNSIASKKSGHKRLLIEIRKKKDSIIKRMPRAYRKYRNMIIQIG